jgi:hypothetical protein
MTEDASRPLACGLVMPISAIDGCSEAHWLDVKAILYEAIVLAGFDPSLVNHAEDVGIIQQRIIQNLYDNPLVVVDVSAKNPNVMFELGLRLAFDKPTIIVKDDKTTYSFDTAPIEHLTYPRDLRFHRIVAFKAELAEKLKATYKKATSDPHYTTFLKHFGEFTIAKVDKKEVSGQQFILEELKALREIVERTDRAQRTIRVPPRSIVPFDISDLSSDEEALLKKKLLSEQIGISGIKIEGKVLNVYLNQDADMPRTLWDITNTIEGKRILPIRKPPAP